MNQSKKLIDKFKNYVPNNFMQALKSLKLSHRLKGDKLTWEFIKECARHFDIESAKEARNWEAVPEVRVNWNQTKKSDACVQVSDFFYLWLLRLVWSFCV
jgi:hypothetical protein